MANALPHQADRPGTLDPETLARVVQAVSDGLQLQWMIEPEVDMAAIIDRLLTMLERPGQTGPGDESPDAVRTGTS
jgi:hypothetical protein